MKNLSLKNTLIEGFTLIELLVVISILAILAGLIISNVSGVRERARDAQRKNDLNEIKSALKMYHNDYDDYPANGTGGNAFVGCGTATPSACSWGSAFTRSNTIYMKILPLDPISTDVSHVYYAYNKIDQDTFTIYALLENKSDSEITKSQSRCGGSVGNAYYVCSD